MSPVLWLQTQASTAMRRRDHKDLFRVLSSSLGLLLAASYNTSNSTEVPGKNTRNTPSILQAVTNTAAGTGRQEPQDRSRFTATSTTCFCFEWWPGKCIPQSKMSNTTGKALPSPVGESHLTIRNTWELRSSS